MNSIKSINEDLRMRIEMLKWEKEIRKLNILNELKQSEKYYDDKIVELERGIELNNKYKYPVFVVEGKY